MSKKRREHSIKLMENYVGLYDCGDCIHGLSGSCDTPLPNGCEFFFDAVNNRSFIDEQDVKKHYRTSDYRQNVMAAIRSFHSQKDRKRTSHYKKRPKKAIYGVKT